METTYLLVGGDRRQFWLSRLLVGEGRVCTLGVPGLEDSPPEAPADVLILPTPCLDGAGLLRRASGEGLDPARLSGLCDARTRVYGGALPADLRHRLPPCGRITDLLADPAVAAVNGRLTAEAAAELAEERLEGSLFGLPCLVLGYGRVGQPLAALLNALHARVTVAARRPGARAEAAQLGCAVRDFPDAPEPFAVVFNTVPAPSLRRRCGRLARTASGWSWPPRRAACPRGAVRSFRSCPRALCPGGACPAPRRRPWRTGS